MSHDLEAAWASTELARKIIKNPEICFSKTLGLNAYAGRDGNRIWPYADGVIDLETTYESKKYLVAVEYKRLNEGTHGILTAIGQSHAYLKKGYSASVMIVPEEYPSLNNVGNYISDVIKETSGREDIGVCTYSHPNSANSSPFKDKITVHKKFYVDKLSSPLSANSIPKIETQWAHVREGSTDPDAFFKYLNAVKLVSGEDKLTPDFNPPKELIKAVNDINPSVNPFNYLSYSNGDGVHDNAWRYFWFKNILHKDMMIGWTKDTSSKFHVNHVLSHINKNDSSGNKQFFSGRSDSIKSKCVEKMNLREISEDEAWIKIAKNFRDRAHSYREDIDSGLEKIGFIEQSGRISEKGYRFLEACERSKDANSSSPTSLMAQALLTEGGFITFLHYIHKLSDEKFSKNPIAFTNKIGGKYKFKNDEYLEWIEDQLVNKLHVLKKVSARGGAARKPLQAELAILRYFNIISQGWRLGVGIPINWPEVQKLQQIL